MTHSEKPRGGPYSDASCRGACTLSLVSLQRPLVWTRTTGSKPVAHSHNPDSAPGRRQSKSCRRANTVGRKHALPKPPVEILCTADRARLERSRSEKREDRRAQADHTSRWNKHRSSQHVGVNLIEDVILLRNAARVDDASHRNTVLLHPIENDPRMQSRAFDGCEQLILRRRLQIPPKRYPA